MDFHNHYHLRDLFTRELFEMYFVVGVRKFAIALIGLFLPLYLLIELGYSFRVTVLFFIVLAVAMAAFLPPAMWFITRYGSKHSILLSMPFLALGLLCAIGLQEYSFLFYVTAILFGVEAAFFWMGFHIDTAINSNRKKLGKESAVISIVSISGAVLGPLVGGFILFYYTFTLLFIVALIALVISVIPLFFSKEVYAKADFDIKKLFTRDHRGYFLAFLAQGVRSRTVTVFWPILIFVVLGSYISLGIYGTIATVFVAFVGYFVGQLSDDMSKRFLIKIAGFFDGILWVLRVMAHTVLTVFTFGTLGGIAGLSIDIPMLAKSYNRAMEESPVEFIFFRELSIRIGQILVLCFALFIGTPESALWFAAFASLFYLFF
jgi:MFS family permease